MGPEFTGERLTPDILQMSFKSSLLNGVRFWAGGNLLRGEHLARYHFAAREVEIEERRILDVACGIGYGADFLNHRAGLVVGLDINKPSLEYANGAYGGNGARFVNADAKDLPFANRSFDLVVSMETIEHLLNPEVFLISVLRVLKEGGVFIVSTPNRLVANPGKTLGDSPKNRFHQREYSKTEFQGLLRKCFRRVDLYGQCLNEAAIRRMPFPLRKVKRLVDLATISRVTRVIPLKDGDEPAILIAICRDPGSADNPL